MRKTKNLLCGICLLLIGIAAFDAGAVTLHQPETTSLAKERQILADQVSVIYTSQIGVRELTGHNDGVEVERYLASANVPKGSAWCASFITWTFVQADVTAIRSAWAPSWFPANRTIYTKGKPGGLIPQKADVFGIYFPEKQRIAHVGFIDTWSHDEYVITVEGNTNNAGSREGDGVYRKRRLKSNIYKVSRWI